MNSPFSKIIEGADRSRVITENEHFIAVLDSKPIVLGHVILISKKFEDHLYDLPNDALASLLVLAKPIAHAIGKTIPCQKIGTAVIGLETRHAHLHLVPISSADDLNFTRGRLAPTEAELLQTADRIRMALKQG